jgi:hypothetical protein
MQYSDLFDAAVIGAGPAGLAIVCELLYLRPHIKIAWIDQTFHSGRLSHYPNVPSNTKIALFLKYCEAIGRVVDGVMEEAAVGKIKSMDVDSHCPLAFISDMVACLVQRIIMTGHISCVVNSKVEKVSVNDGKPIELELENQRLHSKIVILATGSHPSVLSFDSREVIDLETALDPKKLEKILSPNDSVHVFGNSHSGMLVLKNVTEIGAKAVSIYRSPPKYAIYQKNSPQIIYDNTGLKGAAARWAREHWDSLEKRLTGPNGQCDNAPKVVCAVGFKRNESLKLVYNSATVKVKELLRLEGARLAYGSEVIPGLYGAGIAFPGKDIYEYNGEIIEEESVGLFKFCRHAAKDIPVILSDLDQLQ